jgi:hypothetical protein
MITEKDYGKVAGIILVMAVMVVMVYKLWCAILLIESTI